MSKLVKGIMGAWRSGGQGSSPGQSEGGSAGTPRAPTPPMSPSASLGTDQQRKQQQRSAANSQRPSSFGWMKRGKGPTLDVDCGDSDATSSGPTAEAAWQPSPRGQPRRPDTGGSQLAAAQAMLARHVGDIGAAAAASGEALKPEDLLRLVEAVISEHRLSLLEQQRLRSQLGATHEALASARAQEDRLAAVERQRAEELSRVKGDLDTASRKLQRMQEARAVAAARIVVPPLAQPSFLRPTAASASKAVTPEASSSRRQSRDHGRTQWGVPKSQHSGSPAQGQRRAEHSASPSPLPAARPRRLLGGEPSGSSVGTAAPKSYQQHQHQQPLRREASSRSSRDSQQRGQHAGTSVAARLHATASTRARGGHSSGARTSSSLGADGGSARSSSDSLAARGGALGGPMHPPTSTPPRGGRARPSAADIAAAAQAAAWEGWLGGRTAPGAGVGPAVAPRRVGGDSDESSGLSAVGSSRASSRAQAVAPFRVQRRPWLAAEPEEPSQAEPQPLQQHQQQWQEDVQEEDVQEEEEEEVHKAVAAPLQRHAPAAPRPQVNIPARVAQASPSCGESASEMSSDCVGSAGPAGECSSPQIFGGRQTGGQRRAAFGSLIAGSGGGNGAVPRAPSASGSRSSTGTGPRDDLVASCATWLARPPVDSRSSGWRRAAGGSGGGDGAVSGSTASERSSGGAESDSAGWAPEHLRQRQDATDEPSPGPRSRGRRQQPQGRDPHCSISLTALPRLTEGPEPEEEPWAAWAARPDRVPVQRAEPGRQQAEPPQRQPADNGWSDPRSSGSSAESDLLAAAAAAMPPSPPRAITPTGHAGRSTVSPQPGLMSRQGSGGGGSSATAAAAPRPRPPAGGGTLAPKAPVGLSGGPSQRSSSARSSAESIGSDIGRRKLRILARALGQAAAAQQQHEPQPQLPQQQPSPQMEVALPQPVPQQQPQQTLGPLAAAAAARRMSSSPLARSPSPFAAARSPSPFAAPRSPSPFAAGSPGMPRAAPPPMSSAAALLGHRGSWGEGSGSVSGDTATGSAAEGSLGARRSGSGLLPRATANPMLPLAALARAQAAEAEARSSSLQRLQAPHQAAAAAGLSPPAPPLHSRDVLPLLSQPAGLERCASRRSLGSRPSSRAGLAADAAGPSGPLGSALSRSPLSTPAVTPRAGSSAGAVFGWGTPGAGELSRAGSMVSHTEDGVGSTATPRSGHVTPRGGSFLTLRPAHNYVSQSTAYAMYSPLRNNLRSLTPSPSARASPAPSMTGGLSARASPAPSVCSGASRATSPAPQSAAMQALQRAKSFQQQVEERDRRGTPVAQHYRAEEEEDEEEEEEDATLPFQAATASGGRSWFGAPPSPRRRASRGDDPAAGTPPSSCSVVLHGSVTAGASGTPESAPGVDAADSRAHPQGLADADSADRHKEQRCERQQQQRRRASNEGTRSAPRVQEEAVSDMQPSARRRSKPGQRGQESPPAATPADRSTPQPVSAAVFSELFGSVSASREGAGGGAPTTGGSVAPTSRRATPASVQLSSPLGGGDDGAYASSGVGGNSRRRRSAAGEEAGAGDSLGALFGSDVTSYHNPVAALDSLSDVKGVARLLEESLARSDEAMTRGRDQDCGSSCDGGGDAECGSAIVGGDGAAAAAGGVKPVRGRWRSLQGPEQQPALSPLGGAGNGSPAAGTPRRRRRWQQAAGGGGCSSPGRGAGSPPRLRAHAHALARGDCDGAGSDSGGGASGLDSFFENPLFSSRAYDSETASLGCE